MRLSLADIFSILNAVFGFLGLCFEDVNISSRFVLLSAVMDGLDGFVAKRKGSSRFGRELDSLADFLSFGILPSFIVFKLGYTYASIPLLLTSMLRLARFNVLEMEDFLGLPTLASALIVTSFVRLGLGYVDVLSVVLSALMISNFRYFKPKNKVVLMTVGFLILASIIYDFTLYILLILLFTYVISPSLKVKL